MTCNCLKYVNQQKNKACKGSFECPLQTWIVESCRQRTINKKELAIQIPNQQKTVIKQTSKQTTQGYTVGTSKQTTQGYTGYTVGRLVASLGINQIIHSAICASAIVTIFKATKNQVWLEPGLLIIEMVNWLESCLVDWKSSSIIFSNSGMAAKLLAQS